MSYDGFSSPINVIEAHEISVQNKILIYKKKGV